MIKSGQAWSGLIICRDSTGALSAPTVGPVGALYVNGVVNAAAVTISGANPYKWTVTLPALSAGDCVSMYITATIATIATASVVCEDVCSVVTIDANGRVDVGAVGGTAQTAGDIVADTNDLQAQIGTAGAGLTALGDTRLANLNATVSSRSSHSAADVWTAVTRTLTSASDSAGVTTLLTRLSAARAGYLDYLAGWTATIYAEIAALIWGYTSRTLTDPATSSDTTTSGAITRKRGNSWSIAITGLGALTGYTSLWFTIRANSEDADSTSLLQVKKNASGLSDGLLYANGAAASDATKASITIDNATLGNITIAVDETVTDDFAPTSELMYDVQTLIGGSVATPDSGTFTITADVTRAIT